MLSHVYLRYYGVFAIPSFGYGKRYSDRKTQSILSFKNFSSNNIIEKGLRAKLVLLANNISNTKAYQSNIQFNLKYQRMMISMIIFQSFKDLLILN